MSKIVNYNSEIPYNNLPLLPPQAEIESTTILKKTIAASRALSELKGAITNLPNPTLFIDTLSFLCHLLYYAIINLYLIYPIDLLPK